MDSSRQTGGASTTAALLDSSSGGVAGRTLSWQGSGLADECRHVAAQIVSAGARRGDPVCYAAPPGPLGAIAFLAISSVAAAAPLNPKATLREIQDYVERLNPGVLVVDADRFEEVSDGVDMPVHSWEVSEEGRLRVHGVRPLTTIEVASEDDVALILPTSGTTGLPKQVPLAHRQIMSSAQNIAGWLSLGPEDVSLTMMPLFHVHGLVAGLLAPLVANGAAAVEPFDALRFGGLMRQHRPTWFSAVPTMHAVLADRWSMRVDELAIDQLRFLRTSSSALSPSLLQRLEKMYGVPVAEAYGMTEASHQIAANPIDDFTRRPGTVGVATGVDIRIEDPDVDGRGQVLVRGPQVTEGYRKNEEANAESFVDGWFRTGDEGYLEEGWLTLTGRLKEMINRAGEKISPLEVEEVLLGAPGVGSCVVFSIPDERLGEDVGALVVPVNGSFDEVIAREHLRDRLGAHKVPRKIQVADEIPLGPTGKVQRSRIAAVLGLEG